MFQLFQMLQLKCIIITFASSSWQALFFRTWVISMRLSSHELLSWGHD